MVPKDKVVKLNRITKNLHIKQLRCFFRTETRGYNGYGEWWTPDIVESVENYHATSHNHIPYALIIPANHLDYKIIPGLRIRYGLYYNYAQYAEDPNTLWPEEVNDNTMPYYIIPRLKKLSYPVIELNQTFTDFIYRISLHTHKDERRNIDPGQYRFGVMKFGEQLAINTILRNIEA